MTEHDVVRALAALAQQSRLQIFRQLVVAGDAGLTPTRISAALELPSTSLSFHLKELANASLITQERDGRNLIYRAAFGPMNEVLRFLTLNCCEGQPCELAEVTATCETAPPP